MLKQVANDTPEQLFSNTTSVTVTVKAALRSVILGGVGGGLIGSIGRSLQDARTLGALFSNHLGAALGALFLALILSGAGIMFSARKSDAQSFVTVEDFWGGLLIGFLIGYSGTAAFTSITGVHPERLRCPILVGRMARCLHRPVRNSNLPLIGRLGRVGLWPVQTAAYIRLIACLS